MRCSHTDELLDFVLPPPNETGFVSTITDWEGNSPRENCLCAKASVAIEALK